MENSEFISCYSFNKVIQTFIISQNDLYY